MFFTDSELGILKMKQSKMSNIFNVGIFQGIL